ncbi:unnamed protein product [Closterium sp. Naga37s-1]|nr:unnamed protein product [Closterium sp. Naga37s-1]
MVKRTTHRVAHWSMLSNAYGDGTIPKSFNTGSNNEGSPNTGSPNTGSPSTGSPNKESPGKGSTSTDIPGTGSPSKGSPKKDRTGSPSMDIPGTGRGSLNEALTTQVATEVAVGALRLTFSKQAMRSGVTVWWQGRGSLSSGGSSNGGSSYGYSSHVDSGSKAGGVSCAQVKFFGKAGCQGKEVDSMVNTATAAKSPSTKKKLRSWASVASVLCAVPEQQKEDTPQQPHQTGVTP